MLIASLQPTSAQQANRIDAGSAAKEASNTSIVFEAAGGFELRYPHRHLKSDIRLDIGDREFIAHYLRDQPLAPEIDSSEAMQIARDFVQQAVHQRDKGQLNLAYLLYRFALANLVRSDDIAGLEIVTRNVWALRAAAQVQEEDQPGKHKPVLTLITTDAEFLRQVLTSDPRYADSAIDRDTSLRRLRVVRRIADLSGKPTGFAKHAARILASGELSSIPIGWIAPTVEELASCDLMTVLAARGLIQDDGFLVQGDPADLAKAWQLYEVLRPRLHEAGNVAGLTLSLDVAKHNWRRMRSRAVAFGGTYGHSISMFVVSEFLQTFGRDLAALKWRSGERERALALAEEMQSRAVTDWMARSHASNRLIYHPGAKGSMGEVRPASLPEIQELARHKKIPILFYLKTAYAYLLWTILPDGTIETAELQFDGSDLAKVWQVLPYGSRERGTIPVGVEEGRSDFSDIVTAQEVLAELRHKIIPDRVLERIKGHAGLLIVPDGIMNYVPFAALVGLDGRYLIDTFAIRLLPAITTALVLESSFTVRKARHQVSADRIIAVPSQKESRTVKITVGGVERSLLFSPLEGASKETAVVATILKGKVSSEIPTQSRTYLPVLHFATHGYFDVDRPFTSFLVLEEGMLTAEELYFGQKHIETGLVVMSACQTGAGFTHPDSLVGLSNGFLVAGAQSVISTLWPISDAATVKFMETLYRGIADGKALDEALRGAQLALKESNGFAHPLYWAPFQLIGLEYNPL
jgi:hypothetical protein